MPRTARAYSRRRKGYRRAKSMRKRAFKRTRYAKRGGVRSFKRFSRAVVQSTAERKRHEAAFTWNDPAAITTYKVDMANITQGASAGARLANKITCAGKLLVDVEILYGIRLADETVSGLGPVQYRQQYFDCWIIADDRPLQIDDAGAYTPPDDFSIQSIFTEVAGLGWQYKWPRDRKLRVLGHRRVKFDLDDDKYKSESRSFRMTINLRNRSMHWYGTTATAVSSGHVWFVWKKDRNLLTATAAVVPSRVQFHSAFSFIDT